MEVLYIVLALVALLVVYFIVTRNKFMKLGIKIDEAMSGIDVQLEKRYDVLTKLYDLVKKHMAYEEGTLEKIIKLRSGSIVEKQEASEMMDGLLKNINMTFEQYPNLRASESFASLEQAVSETEEHLSAARRLYNSNVSIYNQSIVIFPNSIVSNMMGLTKKEFFQVNEAKKEVSFN